MNNREGFAGDFHIDHGERESRPRALEMFAESMPSEKHPERNEDANFINSTKGVFGIFDGMGGHIGGAEASKIAVETVNNFLLNIPVGLDINSARLVMRDALLAAQNAVLVRQEEILESMDSRDRDNSRNKIATTATVGFIWTSPAGERKLVYGNLGDSRIYRLRGGQLTQLTLDDSLVRTASSDETEVRSLQAKLNNITKVFDEQGNWLFSQKELYLFKNRNRILQALGSIKLKNPLTDEETTIEKVIEERVGVADLIDGDRLLVCSDGVSDNLTDIEIEHILGSTPDNALAVSNLINSAGVRSKQIHDRAKADDMTAIVIGARSNTGPSGQKPKINEGISRHPQTRSQVTNEAEPRRLRKGDIVMVERSDGRVEGDWKFIDFDPVNGRAIVRKWVGDRMLEKRIQPQKLEALNGFESGFDRAA